MKNKKYNHNKILILNTLTVSMLLASSHIYALQAMEDSDLRAINGQDGVQISTTLSEANIDQLYWSDDAGRGSVSTSSTLKATLDNVKVRQNNASTTPLGFYQR